MLQVPLTSQHRRLLLCIMLVGADAQGLMAFCQRWVSSPDNWMEFNPFTSRPYAIFQQPNLLASFIAMGSGIAYYFLVQQNNRIIMVMSCLSLGILVSCLTLQMSRTGWIGGVAVWVLLCGYYARLHFRKVIFASMLVLIIIIAAIVIHEPGVEPMVTPEASSRTRWLVVKYTWAMIMDAPFRGWGYGSFESQFAQFVGASEPDNVLSRITHPHNEILFGWVEGGMTALFGMLLLIIGGCRLLSPWRQTLPIWGLGLPLWLHILTEFPLYQSTPHWLAILLLFRLAIPQENVTRREFSRKSSWMIRGSLIMLAFIVLPMLLTGLQTSVLLTQLERQRFTDVSVLARLPNAYIPLSRIQYDQHTALLISYNHTQDPALLESYRNWGSEYIRVHNDANVYLNLIRIEDFKGNPQRAEKIRKEAQMLFPGDKRFLTPQ